MAWDPLGELLVTQGADRTCRVYGPRPPLAGKKAPAPDAPCVARLSELSCQAVLSKIPVAAAAGEAAQPGESDNKPVYDHLFRDENAGFYKRPAWSPDGEGPCDPHLGGADYSAGPGHRAEQKRGGRITQLT